MRGKLLLLFLLFISINVLGQAPVISSFSPASGPVGTLINVTGTSLTNSTSVTIGGKPLVIVSNTATALVAMAMPSISTGNIAITTISGTATSSSTFTLTQTPVPNLQVGAKLVGTGSIGAAQQGKTVAISADGSTAIVAGPNDNSNAGAAWAYVRSGNSWVQQGSKLVALPGNLYPNYTVALSADGNTAAIGVYGDSASGAYIYVRVNGVWALQASALGVNNLNSGSINGSSAVALSADGNTLLTGDYNDNFAGGSVSVFTRSSKGAWSKQASNLIGTGYINSSQQGQVVALSADGNTAFVAGTNDNGYMSIPGSGAIWIFTRFNGVWTQQGNKLVATGGVPTMLGSSISVSADGNTIATTGRNNDATAWIFTRSNGVWAQQQYIQGTGVSLTTATLPMRSVGLSADGKTLLLAISNDNTNIGSILTFVNIGSLWLQKDPKIAGSGYAGGSLQGQSMALSADANVVIVGGNGDLSGNYNFRCITNHY